MALTKDFSEVLADRIQREPEFATALLDEAIAVFLNGEPDVARLVLRDLVNATIGFEGLATAKGNPTIDNLTLILGVLRQELKVEIQVQTVACA